MVYGGHGTQTRNSEHVNSFTRQHVNFYIARLTRKQRFTEKYLCINSKLGYIWLSEIFATESCISIQNGKIGEDL